MDLRKTPVTGIPACLAVPFKVFNDRKKRDNSRAVTLTWSNKDLRALYVPQKCRPQNKSRARARERGGSAGEPDHGVGRNISHADPLSKGLEIRPRGGAEINAVPTEIWACYGVPCQVGAVGRGRR